LNHQNPLSLSEGSVFLGRYEIVRCIAQGGMGAVYECVHLTTRKRRALKVMLPQVVSTRGMRERFELEARITAEIDSEHIVETFDAGVDDATGAPFLVMELLKGQDLEDMMRFRGPFTPGETVILLTQAAMALDRTHAAGIVHRDLKPQNLFLVTRDDGSPRLKILDFGVAKVVADGTKTAQQTAAIGTPIYMSPEQTTGDGTIGPPADFYALAHIAYALMTGEPYWLAEQQSLPVYAFLSRMLMGPPEAPSARAARLGVTLPAAFDAWFLRAIARVPADRFERASTQIAELALALDIQAPRTSIVAQAPFSGRVSQPRLGSTPPSRTPSAPTTPSRPSAQSAPPRMSTPAGTALLSAPAPAVGSPSEPQIAPTQAQPIAETRQRTSVPTSLTPEPLEPIPPPNFPYPRLMAAGVAAFALVVTGAAVAIAFRSSMPTPAPAAGAVTPTALSASPVSVATTRAAVPVVEPVGVAPAASATPPATTASSVAAETRKRATSPAAPAPPATHAPAAAAPATKNCTPPYTIDAAGHRNYKPECL
jgi:serine/threonine-protein kinase